MLTKQQMYHRQWRLNNKDKVIAYRRNNYLKSQTDPNCFLTKVYHSMKNNARIRNIPFKLTKQDINVLLGESKGVCAMSGVKLSLINNDPNRASIDRIDSNKGYTKDNVQVVTTQVNYAMNNDTKAQFIAMCKAVARRCK